MEIFFKIKSRFLLLPFLACSFVFSNLAYACPEIDGLVDQDCNGKLILSFFGDSITRGVKDNRGVGGFPGRIKQFFPSAIINNLGVPGEYTINGKIRINNELKKSLVQASDYFLVLEGTNDYYLKRRTTLSTRDNLLTILRIAKSSPGKVFLANLTETTRGFQRPWVTDLNSKISIFKEIDLFALGKKIIGGDRVHPTPKGYQQIAEKLTATFKSYSSKNKPKDTDGDGVYDYEEDIHGTSKFASDTDGDGLSDGQELYGYLSNPLQVDSDGDGLTDFQEATFGSNPNSQVPGSPQITNFQVVS